MAIVKKTIVSEGYQAFYDEAQKQLLEVEAEVRKLVEAKTEKLNKIIAMCVEEVEIEVPDEVVEGTTEGEEEPVATDFVE